MPKDRKKKLELFARRRADKKKLLAESISQAEKIQQILKDPIYNEVVNLWRAQSDRLVQQLKNFKTEDIDTCILDLIQIKAQIEILDWLILAPQSMVDWMASAKKEMEK